MYRHSWERYLRAKGIFFVSIFFLQVVLTQSFGCSVILPCHFSFTSSSSCPPAILSWYSPFASSWVFLFSFLLLFLQHLPFSYLLFFLSPFILHIQTYLCNKRLPHMSHIFQKQNLYIRKNFIKIKSYMSSLETHK